MTEDDLRRKVERHDADLYYGQGRDNPPLTTRMAVAEGDIEDVKASVEEIKADSKQVKRMVMTAIATLIVEIIVMVVARFAVH